MTLEEEVIQAVHDGWATMIEDGTGYKMFMNSMEAYRIFQKYGLDTAPLLAVIPRPFNEIIPRSQP